MKNNEKAKLEKEIEDFKLEQKYFDIYFKQQNITKINNLSFYKNNPDKILNFLLDVQLLNEDKIKHKLFYKIKLKFKYKMIKLNELEDD